MKLAELTWKEVAETSTDVIVLIPTGSLEQHGSHLPLFTDSILATKVAEAVERELPETVLLTPTLWLGASGHHLAFPGSLSASFEGYEAAITAVIESLIPHGFWRFFVLNGHGGNTEPNGVAMRKLKAAYPECMFGHSGYFAYVPESEFESMQGSVKGIKHACEAETSLMLHVAPELVHIDKLRNDGLSPHPSVRGWVHHFDEITEEGSWGDATFATAALGKQLFEAAVSEIVKEFSAFSQSYELRGR